MSEHPVSPEEREHELAGRFEAVRERIRQAAAAAGRDPAALTLVVVTKFFPAADVATLVRLGAHEVGESRDQEAGPKAIGVADRLRPSGIAAPRWNFVGQLQTNKARSVLAYAATVHSVDRPKLVTALGRAAAERVAGGGPVLDCFVQVDLDPVATHPAASGGRGGAAPAQVARLAEAVADAEGLRLRGLMAVAPRGADPSRAFAALAALAAEVRAAHPGADALSAGMSGDLEAAVAAGATHLRVGAAILGPRPPER